MGFICVALLCFVFLQFSARLALAGRTLLFAIRDRSDRWEALHEGVGMEGELSRRDRRLYQQRQWRSEGYQDEAKTRHGLARAVRRGLESMRSQTLLTAAINLKRLAAAPLCFLQALINDVLLFMAGYYARNCVAVIQLKHSQIK
jgi:hypothetical protein